jgi:site-specific recombinase XerD
MDYALLNNNTQAIRDLLLNEKRFNANYEVLEAFSKTLEEGLTKTTYMRGARKFIEWCEANNVIEVQEEDIVAYKNYLKANFKASSVNSYITSLKKLYNFLAKKGIKNLASDIHGAKNSKGFKRDALTIDQAKDILKNIDKSTKEGIRNYAIMQLFLTTGLRTIEVERANIEDIYNTGNCTFLRVMGKGHDEKDEVVKLTYETLKAINEYLALRDIKSDKESLFISFSDRSNGSRLKTRSIRDIVKKTFKNVGINSDRLTTHSLRHSAITFALIGGATIQEAQQLARHTNINTTMIYAHNLNRLENKAEESIQKLLNE